jgi:type II secretory pathway component PulC
MINNQDCSIKSISKVVFKTVMRRRSGIVVCGYILASFWLFANAASVFYALKTPIPQQTFLGQGHSENLVKPVVFAELPAFSKDIALLRNPFSYHLALDENPAPSKISSDASGIRLQGVILSRRKGIALKDSQSGAVYFLSEGEEVSGIVVKSITKTGVRVDMNGKPVDFSITGVKNEEAEI